METQKISYLSDVDSIPAHGNVKRQRNNVGAHSKGGGSLKLAGHIVKKSLPNDISPLQGFEINDLYGDEKPSPYICKGVLDAGDMMVVFGESGALKSFFTLDLLMHIATGRDYHGHRVHRTGVLLIAGEGGQGMRRRLKAWCIRHAITKRALPPVFVATQPADLMFDSGAIGTTIEHAESRFGMPIGVVAFDTLGANFGAGDENATKDMAQALATARRTCGDRSVILVHHVGHGDKSRERGAYCLRGAADTRLLVERQAADGPIAVRCLKRKDGELFEPMAFRPCVVDTGWKDADGDSITSLVLDPTDYKPDAKAPVGRLRNAVLEQLAKGPEKKSELVKILQGQSFNRTAIYEALKSLHGMGLVTCEGKILRLSTEVNKGSAS